MNCSDKIKPSNQLAIRKRLTLVGLVRSQRTDEICIAIGPSGILVYFFIDKKGTILSLFVPEVK